MSAAIEEAIDRDEVAVIAAGLFEPWADAITEDTPASRLVAGTLATVAHYLVDSGYADTT